MTQVAVPLKVQANYHLSLSGKRSALSSEMLLMTAMAQKVKLPLLCKCYTDSSNQLQLRASAHALVHM